MISKRYIAFLLLFSNVLLNILAKNAIRSEKQGFRQRIRQNIINLLARKKGYDLNGWVDVSTLDQSLNNINIEIEDNKIVCKSNKKQVIEVTLGTQNLLLRTSDSVYSHVNFEHVELTEQSSFVNPLPVRSFYHGNNSQINNALPEQFEGYIVCVKKGDQAILVPKSFESVEFIEPPWRVRVAIYMHRNPLARYGRQFSIVVLDNTQILLNNANSFIWPVPFGSFADAYDFQAAAVASREGRFCVLERSSETSELLLTCDTWKKNYGIDVVNKFFVGGFIGMNLIQGISYLYTKHEKVSFYFNPERNEKVLLDSARNPPEGVKILEDFTCHNKDNTKKAKLAILSNLVYLGIFGVTNAIYWVANFFKLARTLDRFNKEFQEAQEVEALLPKLEYPEETNVVNENSKTKIIHLDDDHVNTGVENAPEDNAVNTVSEEAENVVEEVPEKPKHDPVVEQQLEEIILDDDQGDEENIGDE